jgi:hypothetical protein
MPFCLLCDLLFVILLKILPDEDQILRTNISPQPLPFLPFALD